MATRTICIADSDAESSAAAESCLKELGFVTVVAATEDAVLQQFGSHTDLLVIDPTQTAISAESLLPKIPLEKKLPIVVVAQEGTREDAILAMKYGGVDWLEKPVDVDTWRACIQRVEQRTGKTFFEEGTTVIEPVTSRALVREIALRIKDGKVDLPEVPQVLRDLNILLQNLEVDADEVTKLVEKDPSLSARLVATANTAAYGGKNWEGRITDVKSTVVRLGNMAIRNLVTTAAVKGMFTFRSPAFKSVFEKMWRAHFMAACLSREIASALEMEDPEEAYLVGLMHNIGELFLLRVFGEFFQRQNNQLLSMDEVMEVVRTYHNVFGEALVRKWDLGDVFAYTNRHHHDLDEYVKDDPEHADNRKMLYLVNLANQLTQYAGLVYDKKSLAAPSLPDSYEALGLPPENREGLRDLSEKLSNQLNSEI